MRGVLAEIAKKDWAKDTSSPETEVRALPPLMDGRNCRPVLRTSQLDFSYTYGVIVQLRSELGGKDLRQGATKMMPPLKPAERELYRLNPLDDVLERRVSLAVCSIWFLWFRIVPSRRRSAADLLETVDVRVRSRLDA